MRLSHNMASLNVYVGYSKAEKAKGKTSQRISSGVKISSAKDNPIGLDKSQKINMQIRGLQMANRNLQDGNSMLQATGGGLSEIASSLQRIRELTVQAGSGTGTDEEKGIIQNEINQMIKGIDELAEASNFNGVNLINGSNSKPIMLAIGPNVKDTMDIPVYNLNSNNIGVDKNYLKDIDVTTSTGINNAIGVIDGAITTVLNARSKYGALENRLEGEQHDTSEISDILTNAYSNITDSDIAAEIIEFSKNGIIKDAGTAMMAQTNRFPQDILKILQNVK